MDRTSLDDFTLKKVLGKGSYGKVMLVEHKLNGSIYAMKMLRKEHVVKRNQVEHTKSERHVLEVAAHPFIVSLHYAFQTPKKLYMVLEYCPGGELFFHLSRAGRFSESKCKFYSSEILLPLEYLHGLDIIYRDLKPENVLLDAVGHVKLTDFGLSKHAISDNVSTRSMCGTPEYLAPEVLDKKGHGKPVDWYSLGALSFEMLTGLPPYYTRDREKLFDRIRHAELKYPAYITEHAKNLLQSLLERDPATRLGSGPRDGADIKSHRFFAGSDWSAIQQKRVEPPFLPSLAQNVGEVKYFEKEFIDLPVVNSDDKEGRGLQDALHFQGFTFDQQSTLLASM